MADGTRLLDFQSQLISDNMGHRHPRVVAGLQQALDRYGHVYFGMATDYRARAAKLIVEDLLGADGWAGRVRILRVRAPTRVDRADDGPPLHRAGRSSLTQQYSFHGLDARRGHACPRLPQPALLGDAERRRATTSRGESPRFGLCRPRAGGLRRARRGCLRSRRSSGLSTKSGPENIAAVITETMLGVGGRLGARRLPCRRLRELTRVSTGSSGSTTR